MPGLPGGRQALETDRETYFASAGGGSMRSWNFDTSLDAAWTMLSSRAFCFIADFACSLAMNSSTFDFES